MPIIGLILYNLFFPVFFAIYLPVYIAKLLNRGDFKEGFGEKFGFFSPAKKKRIRSMKNPVWIHAVSVGETVAALSFIREWSRQEPDLEFVLSTTTSTGQKIAREQSPENTLPFYCPIDYFLCVWLSLKIIKPQMLIIFEVEIWPNLIVFAAWRKTKLALVNGRMSDKSARGYSQHQWFFKYVFSRFSMICTQTEEDARRIKSIIGNLSHVKVCNTMKFDQVKSSQKENVSLLVDSVFPDKKRVIFTAASTHPGEEDIMIRTFKSVMIDFPSLELIIAPRHTERTHEVENILQKEKIDYILLTDLKETLKNESTISEKSDKVGRSKKRVLLVNTTGELMSLFAFSDIVFVGKSLGKNKGGHNIIEPALYGKSIIFGKNMDNFKQVAKIFKDNNAAVEIENEQQFIRAFRHLLSDKAERQRLERMSRKVVEMNRGAIKRTIELLNEKRV